jgi:hypothetical protein
VRKFGNVQLRTNNSTGGGMSKRPGNLSVDGIGLRAAANVLLHATMCQPYTRNTTLCAKGGILSSRGSVTVDCTFWDQSSCALRSTTPTSTN